MSSEATKQPKRAAGITPPPTEELARSTTEKRPKEALPTNLAPVATAGGHQCGLIVPTIDSKLGADEAVVNLAVPAEAKGSQFHVMLVVKKKR